MGDAADSQIVRNLELEPDEHVLVALRPSGWTIVPNYVFTLGLYEYWRRARVYALTDQRVLLRKGRLSKTEQDLPLQEVQDVVVRHSFGYGTVDIATAAGAPSIDTMTNLKTSEAHRVADAIRAQAREAQGPEFGKAAGREAQIAAELDEMAHEGMNRISRFGTGTARRAIAAQVAEDEHVDLLFDAEVDDKSGLLALTERRVLVGYGQLGGFESIDYQSITQVSSHFTTVGISGSGVSLEVRTSSPDELVKELNERRRAASPTTVESAPPTAKTTDDPAARIEQLGRLKEQGLLTDEEFAAKKAELLDRM
jgi:membrane protein YdbS with pleckstrin-like domain